MDLGSETADELLVLTHESLDLLFENLLLDQESVLSGGLLELVRVRILAGER